MKKFTIPVLILAILAIIIIVANRIQNKNQFRNAENNFSVEDTASITKFFLADKFNKHIKAERIDNSTWIINDTFNANPSLLNILLMTFKNIDVKTPVPISMRNTIIGNLASNSVKTEIYQKVYRINLFDKIKLFPHEKLTKTYYVGGETMSNTGTFMLMEGSEQPYIVGIPGLKGYVNGRYSTELANWRSLNLFSKKLNEIKQVTMIYPDKENESFSLINHDNQSISLVTYPHEKQILNFDTLKTIQYMNNFKDLNCEVINNKADKMMLDSIKSNTPYFILQITDKNNVKSELKAWKRKAGIGAEDLEGNLLEWDNDRMYAMMSNRDELYVIQYYAFGNVILPLNWFDKNWKDNSKFESIY